ncbi:MAG: hypothetical protein JST00_42990 [Deltaproteobacteria bacterium]|nr:hypothetical protein [Deltaproteobacteria bacterium]
MRTMRALLPASVVLTLASTPLLAVGCSDSDSGGSTPPPVATVPTSTPDGGEPPDATATDSSTDSGTGATGVTVTTVRYGKPVPNVRVIFHDSAGKPIADLKTDASGKLAAATAPAQVTVIGRGDDASQAAMLVTYTAVAAGDNLVVDLQPAETLSPPRGRFSTTVPLNMDVFAHRADVTRFCRGGGPFPLTDPSIVNLKELCLGAKNTILVEGRSDVGETVAYTWKKGLSAPSAGQTENVTVDEPWSTGQVFALQAINAPAVGAVSGRTIVISDGASFAIRSNPLSLGGVTALGGEPRRVPPVAFAPTVQAAVFAEIDKDAVSPKTVGVLKREPLGASMVLDLATALPQLLTANASGGSAGLKASWTSAAPLTGSDGGWVKLLFYVSPDPDRSVYYDWTFVVPPSATSVSAPTLPADAAVEYPPAVAVKIAFAESTLLPSYKELKSVPVFPSRLTPTIDLGEPLPADGTVRFTIINGSVTDFSGL